MTRRAPRPGLASFRRRILIRGVFLLLVLATLALALVLLKEEKERSYRNHEQAFRRAQAELSARLRQPPALLALLNPAAREQATPVQPLVLPYPALEFDEPTKVQQAVDDAGCAVRWPDGSALCAGVGSNPYAGGFLDLVGSFRAGELVAHESGELDIETLHRASIRLEGESGELQSWVAPFARASLRGEPLLRGRLAGFETTGDPSLASARPVRDFRGWFWQGSTCTTGGDAPDCLRRVFYAMRIPVAVFQQALAREGRPAWPPADLARLRVHLQLLAPGSAPALFDSDTGGGLAPAGLAELAQGLSAGEVLTVTRQDQPQPSVVLKGEPAPGERSSPLILRLIDLLPVTARPAPMDARETLATPVGTYELRLTGDPQGIDRSLSVTATRLSWYVGAMLAAIVLAWLVVEVGLIRRIMALTRRAAAVSHDVQRDAAGGERIGQLDVSDLRGSDELGILAGGLADLLQRVKDDVQREQLRAQQERDMLQAVGHEILSPLQSLMVLHPGPDDPAHRYVQRMQQAVKVLYGQASPTEALQAADLQLAEIDLDAFLREVAGNAHFAGIERVRYVPTGAPVRVRGDAFSLEDVVTHILRNADRYRTPGSEIVIRLQASDGQAVATIHNLGPAIPPARLERIFDYGVSDAAAQAPGSGRGQGLFVARTYMAKMGGTVAARNLDGGVAFDLALPRAG